MTRYLQAKRLAAELMGSLLSAPCRDSSASKRLQERESYIKHHRDTVHGPAAHIDLRDDQGLITPARRFTAYIHIYNMWKPRGAQSTVGITVAAGQ